MKHTCHVSHMHQKSNPKNKTTFFGEYPFYVKLGENCHSFSSMIINDVEYLFLRSLSFTFNNIIICDGGALNKIKLCLVYEFRNANNICICVRIDTLNNVHPQSVSKLIIIIIHCSCMYAIKL